MHTLKMKLQVLFLFLLLLSTACSKDDTPANSTGSSNNLPLGASANDLLSDEVYTSLEIEVAYMSGFEPTTSALNNLETFLEAHTHKPNGIRITKKAIEASGKTSYTISDINDIEKKTRSLFNEEDRLTVYILFADGKSASEEKDKLILGTAYKNTSMVLYEKTIRDFASQSGTISTSEIESTTLKHEFGHLFGLVDNGTEAQSPHEDPESKSHCNVDGCLMLAMVEFGNGTVDLLKSRSQENILFDESCLQDLRHNGGK